ncbi:MAG: hypothetical protein RLZZ365_378 [Pseudomonadota bacterium]|jgi:hypothetical protein
MTKLTNEEISYQISLSSVFDATGLSKSQYSKRMKDLGASVAIGVTPCFEMSHRMRSRSGHCVMCKPLNLAFQGRYEESGDVYVAHSKKLNLIKIGTSANTHERMNQINYYGYGGANDWAVKYIKKVDKADRVEFEAQKIINKNRVWRSYIKDGETVDCQELFDCDIKIAIESVNQSIAVHSKA